MVTLSAVAVYSGYTVTQLRGLRRLQAETIDRNRADSLLLLRIQNNLNSLALTMRDMLDQTESYPLIAWKGQLRRIEYDLADALSREEKVSRVTEDQRKYLAGSVAQFWDGLARIFALAEQGQEEEARTRIRLSLQAREEALSNAVARLLVQNNESEQAAAEETQRIYARAEAERVCVSGGDAGADCGDQFVSGRSGIGGCSRRWLRCRSGVANWLGS